MNNTDKIPADIQKLVDSEAKLYTRQKSWDQKENDALAVCLRAGHHGVVAFMTEYRETSGDKTHGLGAVRSQVTSMSQILGLGMSQQLSREFALASKVLNPKHQTSDEIPPGYMTPQEVGTLFGQSAKWAFHQIDRLGFGTKMLRLNGKEAYVYERESVLAARKVVQEKLAAAVPPPVATAVAEKAPSAPVNEGGVIPMRRVRNLIGAYEEQILTWDEFKAKLLS